MGPYYTVSTPGNDIATTATQLRQFEYFMHRECLPDPDDDFDLACTRLAGLTGKSPTRVANIFMALFRLDELPGLREVHERLFHLDFSRLIVIDQVLCKLGTPDEEALARIDAALVKYLTPTRAGQVLPSVRNLRRKLNALVAAEDPELADAVSTEAEQAAEKCRKRKGRYDWSSLPGGVGCISVEYDTETAAQINGVIRRVADEYGVSASEAFAMLVLTDINRDVDVTLNVFQAADLLHAPVFIEGTGWTDAETGAELAGKASRRKDMNAAAWMESTNYVTPDRLKAYLNGRDGTCRYPGCCLPAYRCQKDHCVDFADGGPTAAWNLVNLCQHHHNIKTDKRARYILDPATGDVVWLFTDGTWQTTTATGPLAPETCNWLQTVDQAIATRRANARERALNTTPELDTPDTEPTNSNTHPDTEPDRDYEEEPPF